jgi:hypothetical protein
MTKTPMTPDQEFDFYAQPENQEGSRARTAPDRLTRYAQHAVFSQVNARELRSTDETRPVPDASRHLMCVVIVCTMASRCIRRYVHDME